MYEKAYINLVPSNGYNLTTFAIPINHTIPETLKKCTPEQFAEVLIISHKIRNIIQTTSDTNSYSVYEKELADEISRVKKDYERRLDTIQEERSNLERTLAEQREATRIFKQNIQSSIQECVNTSIVYTKESHNREIERVQQFYKNSIENIERLQEGERTRLLSQLKETQEQLKEVQTSVKLSQASVIKGSTGEATFSELVKQHTTWTNIEDTSKTAQSADMKGIIGNVETLFEVKNYKSDVPSKEVVKFVRDMEVHSNIPYGVFISMNSGITGKKSQVSSQWTSHGQLCIFISKFLETDIKYTLEMVEQCSGIASRVYSLHHRSDVEELENYKEKLMQVKLIITRQMIDINDMIIMMGHDKKLLIDSITKQHTMYKTTLEKMKVGCNQVMELILGSTLEEPMSTSDVGVDVVELSPTSPQDPPVLDVVDMDAKKKRKKKGAV